MALILKIVHLCTDKQSIFAGLNFNPYEEPAAGSGPPSMEVTATSGSNEGSITSGGTQEKHRFTEKLVTSILHVCSFNLRSIEITEEELMIVTFV